MAIKACVMNENYLSRAEICIYSPLASHYGPLLSPQKIKGMKTRSTTFNAVCWVGSNNNCSCENGKLIENQLTEDNISPPVFHIPLSEFIKTFHCYQIMSVIFLWQVPCILVYFVIWMVCLVFDTVYFDDGMDGCHRTAWFIVLQKEITNRRYYTVIWPPGEGFH